MNKTIPIFIAAVFIFQLFFCGIFRHDAEQSAIVSLANEKQFDCVVKVTENDKNLGSGVLISPNYILTAVHIIISTNQLFNKKKKTADIDPADFRFVVKGKTYIAKRFIIHPDFLKNGMASGTDLMLVELQNVVPDIIPATLNTNFDELGALVTGVGYGISGIVTPKGILKTKTAMDKTAGRNTIDEFGGKIVNDKPSLLLFDFDNPDNPETNKMGSAIPVDLEYTTAGGDSGGGLFRKKNNRWELLGILHGSSSDIEDFRKNGYYGQISQWTRVSLFKDWIQSYTN